MGGALRLGQSTMDPLYFSKNKHNAHNDIIVTNNGPAPLLRVYLSFFPGKAPSSTLLAASLLGARADFSWVVFSKLFEVPTPKTHIDSTK
jgi:hypothetical protein